MTDRNLTNDELAELGRLLTELDDLKARLGVVHRRLRELGFDTRTMRRAPSRKVGGT